MSLLGLHQRHTLCKICNAFEDARLNDITLDILMQRRTWNEICDHYSKLLPPSVAALNHVNLNSHRRHCDPKLIAEDYLRERGEPVTPAEAIMRVFSEKFLEELDRKKLLTETYRARLRNLETLQTILEERIALLNTLPVGDTEREIEDRQFVVNEIRSLSKQIDSSFGNMQDVVVKELNHEKGVPSVQSNITVNFINSIQIHMQNFLQELVPYVLMDLFKNDQEKGKEFLAHLSKTMDRHLGPALDETKLLQQVNK